jgi:hypothetical protein
MIVSDVRSYLITSGLPLLSIPPLSVSRSYPSPRKLKAPLYPAAELISATLCPTPTSNSPIATSNKADGPTSYVDSQRVKELCTTLNSSKTPNLGDE